MTRYKANNGVIIKTGDFHTQIGDESWSSVVTLNYSQVSAFSEYIIADIDEKLQRWRNPENPHFVVYWIDSDRVRVLDELTGMSYGYNLLHLDTAHYYPGSKEEVFSITARAFVKVHNLVPVKPWARPSEGTLWLLTLVGEDKPRLFAWTETALFEVSSDMDPRKPLKLAHNDSSIIQGEQLIVSDTGAWVKK